MIQREFHWTGVSLVQNESSKLYIIFLRDKVQDFVLKIFPDFLIQLYCPIGVHKEKGQIHKHS